MNLLIIYVLLSRIRLSFQNISNIANIEIMNLLLSYYLPAHRNDYGGLNVVIGIKACLSIILFYDNWNCMEFVV